MFGTLLVPRSSSIASSLHRRHISQGTLEGRRCISQHTPLHNSTCLQMHPHYRCHFLHRGLHQYCQMNHYRNHSRFQHTTSSSPPTTLHTSNRNRRERRRHGERRLRRWDRRNCFQRTTSFSPPTTLPASSNFQMGALRHLLRRGLDIRGTY